MNASRHLAVDLVPEGFTPNRCAVKCAVRFEPLCANTGFFDTSAERFRAG